MSDLLLCANDAAHIVHFSVEKKGVKQKSASSCINRLKHHREPSIELLLQFKASAKHFSQTTVEWVKSQQDIDVVWETYDDLQATDLSPTACFNVWCNTIVG
jgi:hypothetical protein